MDDLPLTHAMWLEAGGCAGQRHPFGLTLSGPDGCQAPARTRPALEARRPGLGMDRALPSALAAQAA
jgi:hypothetical protein